ncbi:hypothetical protein Ciccas_013047 [Cichlidogyrus casuarinus]|uniref:DUF4781 domain-containing protein n=1 Tax=Cichlidogyrus casuarinus TaxID=1844966 RepID=A0ABD2PNF6_9PLAT
MDASNYSQFKKYVNDLFSRHGSSLGTADFDQLFDESYSFYEELLTDLKRLFAADQLQLQLLEKLERSCIYPLWLKVAYLMFGAPELTEEKTLYTEEEQEVINKNNKLSPMKNKIFIPENGRYAYKDNGKVRKERRKNFWRNKAKEALSFTGESLSTTTAVAGGAVTIGAIAVTAVAPPLGIAAAVLGGVSSAINSSMAIARIVDKAKHGENKPRNYVFLAIDLAISIVSGVFCFPGVGFASTVAKESSLGLKVFQGCKAAATIGGGIGYLIIDNTMKILEEPDKLVIPGVESQAIPEIQEMFSRLSPQYQMVVNLYLIIRHKFKSGTLTVSDYLEFNCMLLAEFNVLDWQLTSSLLQIDLVLTTCDLPRRVRTNRYRPKIRLLNEKSAELSHIICKFRLLISELEKRFR